MSCLDVPRLHFKGHFHANPSTINNDETNYNYQQRGTLDTGWNPYGDATFSIDAKVTTLIGPDAKPFKDARLVGTSISSVPGLFGYSNVPAKLVDLDPDQQTRTRYYGMNIQLGDSRSFLLQGHFVDTAFIVNLWFGKVGEGGDAGAGGLFQTILKPLKWNSNVSSSPFLKLLRETAKQNRCEISIRFAVFGYNSSPFTPGFTKGTIIGTLGLAKREEPVNRIVNRFLSPTKKSPLWFSSAAVVEGNSQRPNTLTIDLSNSIPDQSPGGLPLDLGTLEVAILGAGKPTIVGKVAYKKNQYQQTGGILQYRLSAKNLAMAKCYPLAVLRNGKPALAESKDGCYAAVDAGYLFMNPKDNASVNLYATKFGEPCDDGFSIRLMKSPNGPAANNKPKSGLNIKTKKVSTTGGRGEIELTAGEFAKNPPRRKSIDGQVYFVGGTWASEADGAPKGVAPYIGAPLSVKVFNGFSAPKKPTWKDVAPILYQYYILYATMAGRVDLSNYESVKAAASAIKSHLSLDTSDPSYMPVTRDLSAAKKQMIIKWIDDGCPS